MPATGAGWALALLAFAAAGFATTSVAFLVIGIVLLDIAIQSLNILNQTRLFAIDPAARSRLNTATVTANFLAGAVGSALATWLWSAGAWPAVTIAGIVLCLFGLAVWVAGRRGPLAVAPAP